MKNLILVGDSAFAEVALEYFTHDSPYTVVAFAVERDHRKKDSLLGLPVVDIESIESAFPADSHAFHAAIAYNQFNRTRARLVEVMCGKGYAPVSYVSSTVRLWPSTVVGSHCFIFENNVIQPYARIGDNCVLWSGNHIGHHSRIGDNCFISSHVVVSGLAKIGDNTFVGVNSTIADNVEIGCDCLVGAGAVVSRSIPDDTVIRPVACKQSSGARRFMRL